MDARKQHLIVQLFSYFPTREHMAGFENLLRAARLEVTERTVRGLGDEARRRSLSFAHAWLRHETADWDGPVGLFVWLYRSLFDTLSSLGTLDDRVVDVRRAKKIIVVPEIFWRAALEGTGHHPSIGWFEAGYAGLDEHGQRLHRPVLVLRLDAQSDYKTAIELGLHLGTRSSRQSVTNLPIVAAAPETATGPPDEAFQIGVSSLPSRNDETTREVQTDTHALPGRVREVPKISGSKRPDPRCDDEDQRDTIEPPPSSPLPEREDPTEPKR